MDAIIIFRSADHFATISVEQWPASMGTARYVWTVEAGHADAAGFATTEFDAIDLATRRRHAMMCESLALAVAA